MNSRVRKILAWTVGMGLAGAILGAKSSYAQTWYGALVDQPAFVLGGAGYRLHFRVSLLSAIAIFKVA